MREKWNKNKLAEQTGREKLAAAMNGTLPTFDEMYEEEKASKAKLEECNKKQIETKYKVEVVDCITAAKLNEKAVEGYELSFVIKNKTQFASDERFTLIFKRHES